MKKWHINKNENGDFLNAILPLPTGQAVIRDTDGARFVEFRASIVGVDNITTFRLCGTSLETNIKDAEANLEVHFKGLSDMFKELYASLTKI